MITMECVLCDASVTASVPEAIAWSAAHDAVCVCPRDDCRDQVIGPHVHFEGEPFRVGDCQGHSSCPVTVHEHGCYADLDGSACNDPAEHVIAESSNHEEDSRG